MNRRLEQFMKAEKLTSAKFAEILSVQPSSISHLLSGRNKPNFDFISRLLLMFPQLNPRWIINGEGSMYIDENKAVLSVQTTIDNEPHHSDIPLDKRTLFDNQSIDSKDDKMINDVMQKRESSTQNDMIAQSNSNTPSEPAACVMRDSDINDSYSEVSSSEKTVNSNTVERILLLYNDHTFDFYNYSNK